MLTRYTHRPPPPLERPRPQPRVHHRAVDPGPGAAPLPPLLPLHGGVAAPPALLPGHPPAPPGPGLGAPRQGRPPGQLLPPLLLPLAPFSLLLALAKLDALVEALVVVLRSHQPLQEVVKAQYDIPHHVAHLTERNDNPGTEAEGSEPLVGKARNPGASSLTWIQCSLLQIQAELNQLDEALVKELNLLLDLLPHLLDQGPVVLLQIQVDLDHMVDVLAPRPVHTPPSYHTPP